MLLGGQSFDPLRQLAVPVLADIRSGIGEVQVAFMLERLGGGAVGDPVLLELIQVLSTLEHDDDGGKPAGHPDRALQPSHYRQGRGNGELEQLQPRVATLVLPALAVVPADLVFEPLPGWVLGRWSGHRLDRSGLPESIVSLAHPVPSQALRLGPLSHVPYSACRAGGHLLRG